MKFEPSTNPDWRLLHLSADQNEKGNDWIPLGALGWQFTETSAGRSAHFNFNIIGDADCPIELRFFVIGNTNTQVTLVVDNQVILEEILSANAIAELKAEHTPGRIEHNTNVRHGTLLAEPLVG